MIDSHCHLNDELFIGKEKEYIEDSLKAGVDILFNIAWDLNSSKVVIKQANMFDNVYAAIGIIPAEVKNAKDDDLIELEKLIVNKKVKAIGEIGLDYYWDKDELIKNKQKDLFIKQIDLANKYNLPIVIHTRDSLDDAIKILKEHPVKKCGVVHCFSGSAEQAKEFIKLGYILGIGGTSTFKNANKLLQVIKSITDNDYVLETDAPYLTPVPYRGTPNHSKYIPLIRDQIAFLRGICSDDVDKFSTKNFKRVFLNEN